jgi:outer membrane protein W
MKKVTVFIMMILAAALVSHAAVRISLCGGYASHSESAYGSGIAFGLNVGYDLTPNIALELRATRFQSNVTAVEGGLSAGKMTVMPIELAFVGRLPVGDSLTPYFVVGGGYGFHSFSPDAALVKSWNDLGITLAESIKSGPTILVGAGLDFLIAPGVKPGSGFLVNFEARYLIGKTDGTWTFTDQTTKTATSGPLAVLPLDTIMFSLGLKYGF